MNHSMISVLLPEYRRQVLGMLLLHPEMALHGREIARQTGLTVSAVLKELNKLADAGFLLRRKQGNQQIFQANTACPIYPELVSILKKTSGMADVLIDALSPIAPLIKIGFIFGSIAKHTETAGSDIDLLLIGELTFEQAVKALWPLQGELGREINPKIFSPEEFQACLGQAFLREVLSRPKIFIIGTENDLTQLVGRQP
jgi:predicted nucleotidyltransferase/biotin operon repressor